ncbi:hypothetical protein DID75_05530 [Candidatus Marinamargulisbacteria bacterium SCGC AG-410-N11]|nr:hypothetical protein DID75_05530 [Candidatus Marinamargulisbacteria bacterium SCGC AG-410-N11]
MDFMVLIGVGISIAAILVGCPDIFKDLMNYLQPNAMVLVLVGTIGSTFISSSKKSIVSIGKVFKHILFRKKKLQPLEAVDALVDIAKIAQTASKQSLADLGGGKGDGFLGRALGMVADGLEKDFVNQTLITDISEISRRHELQITAVKTMGSYAPMYGMLGTVVGVIMVLKNVSDIDVIVEGMALALLTTLYGLFLSSVFFIPLSNKLKGMNEDEVLTKEIIRVGILMIMDKEIPLKVEKYLLAYIEQGQKNDRNKEK